MIHPRFTDWPLKLNVGDVLANDFAFGLRQSLEPIAHRLTAATGSVEDGGEFGDVCHDTNVPQKVRNAITLSIELLPATLRRPRGFPYHCWRMIASDSNTTQTVR